MRYIARQSDNTVEPLQNGHLEDRRKWPMWRGSDYGEVGFFGWGGGGGVYVNSARFMFTAPYNGNPFLNDKYR